MSNTTVGKILVCTVVPSDTLSTNNNGNVKRCVYKYPPLQLFLNLFLTLRIKRK